MLDLVITIETTRLFPCFRKKYFIYYGNSRGVPIGLSVDFLIGARDPRHRAAGIDGAVGPAPRHLVPVFARAVFRVGVKERT